MNNFPKIASFKDVGALRSYLAETGVDIPLAETGCVSSLSQPAEIYGHKVGNRWALLPMEGWDCMPDGRPSALTRRRWLRFAESGAKLIAGTEAGAVMHAARSNPHQLLLSRETLPALKDTVASMRRHHAEIYGTADDLMIGIQLTHSGRFAHPNRSDRLESIVAYNHPYLDRKFGAPHVLRDDEIPEITDAFADAAAVAREAGFDFIDVKHAHGYLGHEFLSAVDRPGPYGGSFENRTRFTREILDKIKDRVPDMPVAMRFSFFDIIPFVKGPDGIGMPMGEPASYKYGFGCAADGLSMDENLAEPVAFVKMMRSYGLELIVGTIGSPYYNVHIQRPAAFPVCDGYEPPVDPLFNVARHIAASKRMKELVPEVKTVLSGITYLQEYAANAAEAAIASGAADFAGLGRMALSYPRYCADTLAGKSLDRCSICRTFGDCTNAPRHGLVSGCDKLDAAYREVRKPLNTGLVSISFRKHSVDELVSASKDAGLSMIEWGSDVHAGHDKVKYAAEATRAAGLSVSSYGTYFRLGVDPVDSLKLYLDDAGVLGTDIVRIWAGNKGYGQFTPEMRTALLDDCVKAARMAEEAKVTLCFECHPNTYTDCLDGALELMSSANSSCIGMYWQPNQNHDLEWNLAYARGISKYVKVIHVFNWNILNDGSLLRKSLSEAEDIWLKYLQELPADAAKLLEFVPDDSLASLYTEAAALKIIVSASRL